MTVTIPAALTVLATLALIALLGYWFERNA